METLAQLAVALGADLSPLERGMDRAITTAQRRGSSVGSAFGVGFNRSIGDHLTRLPHMLQGAQDALRIGGNVTGLFQAGNIERQTIAFETLLGSQKAARSMMRDISSMALESPFDAMQMRDFAQQMLAADFSAQTLVNDLRAISDQAALMNTGAFGVERLVSALSKIRQSPTLQGDELEILRENRIPILPLAEAGTGRDFKNIGEAVAHLQTLTGEQVAETLIRGMRNTSGGAGKRIANDTLLGVFANAREGIETVMEPTGQALSPVFTQAGTLIRDAAGSMKTFNEATGGTAGLTGVIGLGTIAVRGMIGGLVTAKTNVDLLTGSLLRLSAVPPPMAAAGAGVPVQLALPLGGAAAGAAGGAAATGGFLSRVMPLAKSVGLGLGGAALSIGGGLIAPDQNDRSTLGYVRETASNLFTSVGTGAQWGAIGGPWGALAGAGLGSMYFGAKTNLTAIGQLMGGKSLPEAWEIATFGKAAAPATPARDPAEGLRRAMEENTRALQDVSGNVIGGGSRARRVSSQLDRELALVGVLGYQ